MNGPAVVLEGLRIVRGGNVVLPGLDLEIAPGRITGLLGPSGSGKTTLMRAIVGVQVVASGRCTVLGLPAGDQRLRSRVGYVTQAPSVYPDLTVAENLSYFRRILRASASRVDEVLDTVGLAGESGREAGRLSGGQRARVSLATALLNEPELLVLDEPTVGLDPRLRVELWQTFAGLATAGNTLIVSSHVMDEAERCDDLVLLQEGEVVATGTPAGLRHETGAADVEGAFLAIVGARP